MIGITDACTRDCVRVLTDPRILSEEEATYYWDRPRVSAKQNKAETSKGTLLIESGDKPCKVGFKVDRKHGCPLLPLDDFGDGKVPDLKVLTDVVRRVLQERIGHKDWPN